MPCDFETIKQKRNEILQTAAKYGASNIRVFGSVARGEFYQGSDIDFLIDLEPGRSLMDAGGLLMDLQELLGCPVDVVPSDCLRKSFHEQVMKEAIPI